MEIRSASQYQETGPDMSLRGEVKMAMNECLSCRQEIPDDRIYCNLCLYKFQNNIPIKS